MFCTFYKWYIKSLLIRKSFYNIFEHEEPGGLALLQSIFDRIAEDRIIMDNWELSKKDIIEYFNPKYDLNHKKFIRTSKPPVGVTVPENVLNNIEKVENGIEFITLHKALVPIKNKVIQTDIPMKKANDKPVIYFDMDGVVADFIKGYKDMTGRDANIDDEETITLNCSQIPNFFRKLPILEKGKELFNELINFSKIIFLTTPMDFCPTCRRDKIEWVKEHFGSYDIIFSKNKADYAKDDQSILIDDMLYNLEPFSEAGGTAIDIKENNDKIIKRIRKVLGLDIDETKIKKDLIEAIKKTEIEPSEAQKKAGNYIKGKFRYKGLEISIENPKGSTRWGVGFNGKKWRNVMNHHYGYIKKTTGSDEDHIDVFIGDNLKSNKIFIINQDDPKINMFDEHKIMIGFDNPHEAKQAYLSNYNKSWNGFRSIEQCTMKVFKKWLKSGNMDEPFIKNILKVNTQKYQKNTTSHNGIYRDKNIMLN
jgi:5'(3')-deoxyribonucleotidase